MKSNIFNKINLILKYKINILAIFFIALITFFFIKYNSTLHIYFKYINFSIFLIFTIFIIFFINKYFYNIKDILQEINNEKNKIIWPSTKETLHTTLIILIISLLISIILWCLDNIIFYTISFITSIK